jgi:hypothetical protein
MLHDHHITGRSRRPVAARAAAALALSLAALIVPASASAAWTTPVDLSASGQDAYDPAVAVALDGDSVLAWQRSDGFDQRIEARTMTETGALGPVMTLSAAGEDAIDPRVGVDDDGNGVIAWERYDGSDWRVQVRPLSEASVLGATQTLSAAGNQNADPDIAVDEAGDAVIVWRNGTDQRIVGRTRDANGVLGARTWFSDAGGDAYGPRVDIDGDGDAVAAWLRHDGTNYRAQVRPVSNAGVFGADQTISDAGADAVGVEVAVDIDGDATLAWARWDGANDRVQARTRSSAGALGAIATLSAAGQDAHNTEVGVEDNGDGVVVWERFDGADFRIQARSVAASGVLGAVSTISIAGENALDPEIAVDADGDAVIAWKRWLGPDMRAHAKTMSNAGVFGPGITLSDAGESASEPKVGVDELGDAVVTWHRHDGTDSRVQVTTGP